MNFVRKECTKIILPGLNFKVNFFILLCVTYGLITTFGVNDNCNSPDKWMLLFFRSNYLTSCTEYLISACQYMNEWFIMRMMK